MFKAIREKAAEQLGRLTGRGARSQQPSPTAFLDSPQSKEILSNHVAAMKGRMAPKTPAQNGTRAILGAAAQGSKALKDLQRSQTPGSPGHIVSTALVKGGIEAVHQLAQQGPLDGDVTAAQRKTHATAVDIAKSVHAALIKGG